MVVWTVAGCWPGAPSQDRLVDLDPPADGVQLRTPLIEVPADSEILDCRVFDMPFEDVACIGRIEAAFSDGVHHASIHRGGVCPPVEGPALVDMRDRTSWTLPEDAAIRLAPGERLALVVDAVNGATQGNEGGVVAAAVNLERVACEGTEAVEPLALPTDGDRRCTFPEDVRIVGAVAGGSLAVDGEDPFYEGDAFEEVEVDVESQEPVEWIPSHAAEHDFRFGPELSPDRPAVLWVAPSIAGAICG